MEADKGKKKYRYTYYTATGKKKLKWTRIGMKSCAKQIGISITITVEKNIKVIT